jgi:uncharacterized membrane protein YccF (DUF307 family)
MGKILTSRLERQPGGDHAPDPEHHLVDLCGLWLALGYFLAGIICFILIITIPFGFAAFRIGVYALWPFGYTVVDKPGVRPGAAIGNVVWLLVAGIWLAIGHVLSAIAMAITIIGIPAGHRQPQAHPGLAAAAGQGDRAHRSTRSPGGPVTLTDLGLPMPVRRAPAGMPGTGPLVDSYGRVATDLRVSLTDRCNLRCTYCMPAEGLDWLPDDQLLSSDELARLLRIAVTGWASPASGSPVVSRWSPGTWSGPSPPPPRCGPARRSR